MAWRHALLRLASDSQRAVQVAAKALQQAEAAAVEATARSAATQLELDETKERQKREKEGDAPELPSPVAKILSDMHTEALRDPTSPNIQTKLLQRQINREARKAQVRTQTEEKA